MSNKSTSHEETSNYSNAFIWKRVLKMDSKANLNQLSWFGQVPGGWCWSSCCPLCGQWMLWGGGRDKAEGQIQWVDKPHCWLGHLAFHASFGGGMHHRCTSALPYIFVAHVSLHFWVGCSWCCWIQRRHVRCIQGPTGVALYCETGSIIKGGVPLKTFRCARGSTSLESFHCHLNRFIPGLC